ncbi:DUF3040 domain-containing protein [Micrococcoides hystricis]|uniref:DUF3040 domain-containing protein n=1 Tax=Micrococcoides hystricis TaxID=1572761 RepID=A0ABV6P6S5_9MICC
MGLSEKEKKILEQLQAQLAADDPRFASRMEEEAESVSQPGLRFSRRRITIGILVFVLGIAGLLVGISMQLIVVGILGFLVMVAGVVYGTSRAKTGAGEAASSGEPKKPSGFMQNLESKWDERQNGDR